LRCARAAVLAYFVVLGLAEGIWIARIPGIKARLQLTDGLLGAALLVGPAGLVLVMPVAGRLADRFGSALLSRPAGTAVAIMPLVLWTAGTWAAVLGALLAFGVAGGMLAVAMNAQGVRVEQAYGRPLMASFHASYSFGGLAGAVLGGLLAWWRASPVAALSVIALAGAAAVLIAGRWLMAEPAGPGRRRPSRPASARAAVGPGPTLLGTAGARHGSAGPRLLALGLLALCCLIAEGAAGNWSGVYLRDDLGTSRWLAAAGFAGFSVAMAAGRLAGDRLARRYGPMGLVCRCGLLAAAGLAGALGWHNPIGAVAGFAVFGAGLSCTVPQLLSAAGHTDPQRPGAGIARVASLGYLGLVGGPALIGGCASLAGLPAALCLPVALTLCVAAFAYVLDKASNVSGNPANTSHPVPGRRPRWGTRGRCAGWSPLRWMPWMTRKSWARSTS
jgi:MFS family permease